MVDRPIRRRSLLAASAAGLGGLVAGCSSSSTPSTAAPAVSQAKATGNVKLTMWSWATNLSQVVAIWNKAHPEIQVSVSNVAQGDPQVAKVLTATKAGNAPDIFHAEYQSLPVYVAAGAASDLTDLYTAVKGKYSQSAWDLVSFGGKPYGMPQDVAPMGLFYRVDLFKQYGLTVPTTWDEFASTAKELHQKDAKRYLTTFSSGDPGWFAGLSEQAGAQWWTNKGSDWTVAINDAATSKVSDYWSGLVSSGVVQGQPMYTPQWNSAMSNGTLLAWPSAVWGAGVLEGVAPSTKGKWQLAPMPQWTAGANATGFWGGSSDAISTKTKHRAEAIEFLTWLNTSTESVDALISIGGLYPASLGGQSSPELAKAPVFMPNQKDYFAVAQAFGKGARGFTWGPDVNVTYNSYTDAFGKAISTKKPFSGALAAVQAATVADMKHLGYTVTTA